MHHGLRQPARKAPPFSPNPRVAVGGSILGVLVFLDLLAALFLGRMT
jgi:hypothetical protein